MEQAKFELKSFSFVKAELDFTKGEHSDLVIDISPRGVFDKENQSYQLVFDFRADLKECPEISLVKTTCVALFKFNNVSTLEEIPDYFYANSIAIVFPYVRAFVSNITLQANIRPLIIPTFNLSSLRSILIDNTSIK